MDTYIYLPTIQLCSHVDNNNMSHFRDLRTQIEQNIIYSLKTVASGYFRYLYCINILMLCTLNTVQGQ